ncbi:MAG: hypothetical protein Q4A76_04405, partial [Porphyromonadaceae bacterium]|nr:hypothetical protein [Porphyromonadaceae bacterium]
FYSTKRAFLCAILTNKLAQEAICSRATFDPLSRDLDMRSRATSSATSREFTFKVAREWIASRASFQKRRPESYF